MSSSLALGFRTQCCGGHDSGGLAVARTGPPDLVQAACTACSASGVQPVDGGDRAFQIVGTAAGRSGWATHRHGL